MGVAAFAYEIGFGAAGGLGEALPDHGLHVVLEEHGGDLQRVRVDAQQVAGQERPAALLERVVHLQVLAHGELVEAEVAHCSGRVVKDTGDGALAMFDLPGDAIDFATSMATTTPAAEVPNGPED